MCIGNISGLYVVDIHSLTFTLIKRSLYFLGRHYVPNPCIGVATDQYFNNNKF